MNKILLISEKQIKDQSIVEHNTDPKILSKIILNVQETQLKPIMGKDLYATILNEVVSVTSDSTYVMGAFDKELLDDYISPFLVYATLCDFILINNYKVANKGLMKMNDNSASSSTNTEIEYVKSYYENYQTTYKNNLIEFLEANKLIQPSADVDVTSNAIGWFLDNTPFVDDDEAPTFPYLSQETDPFWEADKNNYYTITQIDALLAAISFTDIDTPDLDNTIDLGKYSTTYDSYNGSTGIGIEYL